MLYVFDSLASLRRRGHIGRGQTRTLLAEHMTTGALVRNYIYLNGQPLALVDGAGTVSYILTDQVGQPQKMLNASGAVSWHRVAGIFGDTVSQPVGTTAANPLRFPGQQFDPLSALHYNYFRDYDPATGRYLETDPIGLNGGMNVYAYADGNPVNSVDQDGLKVVIVTKDRKAYSRLLRDYYKLNRSKHARDMMKGMEESCITYKIVPIDKDAFYCPPGAGGKCVGNPNTVFVDPYHNIKLPTTAGLTVTPMEIVLGHEFGHADGTYDDGPNSMNNVNANENPIRTDLGYPLRTSYTVPAIVWVPR